MFLLLIMMIGERLNFIIKDVGRFGLPFRLCPDHVEFLKNLKINEIKKIENIIANGLNFIFKTRFDCNWNLFYEEVSDYIEKTLKLFYKIKKGS